MGNTPGQSIFKDDREFKTRVILKQSLITGNITTFRAGCQLVSDEFRQAALKASKGKGKGITGHEELQRQMLEYLTHEFKMTVNDGPTNEPANVTVMEADFSYPKTPLMHAIDFDNKSDHMEICNKIKAEIERTSKKQQTTAEDGEPEFDRGALAKQRLMAKRAESSKKNTVTARPITDAASMMSDEEKAMLAKLSSKINKK